jgi:DNA-binding PadR family transcriptional regulator
MKEAVLGLIVERRGYGYDLVCRFNDRFGAAWNLNQSTIYVALDDLYDKGFVTAFDRNGELPEGRLRRSMKLTYEGAVDIERNPAARRRRGQPQQQGFQYGSSASRPRQVVPVLGTHGACTIASQRARTRERPAGAGPSGQADDGTRTHDLLHGKQTL